MRKTEIKTDLCRCQNFRWMVWLRLNAWQSLRDLRAAG